MSDQFIGKVLAGKYQVGEIISESDFGKIYHGTHLLMEKPVTIKILSPSLAVDANIVRQFSAEAKTASRISHPNILNVTDFNADQNGTVYLVMESADGETLKNTLEREGKFAAERAFTIARQTAAALSAAHSSGIFHRFLNTENILLTNDLSNREVVKVLGFGSIAPDYNQNLEDNEFIDDLKYLSPEQDSQISEADERSDIYSLGVIFYEMLAGETPFTAETPTDLMLKKSEELPAPLSAFRSDLPEGIEPLILKSLAKNPEMRQQSAAAFVEELNRATNYTAEQETIVIPRQAAAAAPNNIWKTAFIVLAGISLMAFTLIYATSVKQTNPQTQMQLDANGQPVQPINPATGMNEQGASNMIPFSANAMEDANMMPQTMPGGDGYDAWGRGIVPPGAPQPVYPGGQVTTIPSSNNNPLMPSDQVDLVYPDGTIVKPDGTNIKPDGTIIKPDGTRIPPANSKTSTQSLPTNSSKERTTQTNTQPQSLQTPTDSKQNQTNTKPAETPTPKKETPKQNEQPTKSNKPSSEKSTQSGKKEDSE